VDARSLASPNIVIILVGNKKDLDAEREVTFLEASRFAQENGKFSTSLLCSVPESTCIYLVKSFTVILLNRLGIKFLLIGEFLLT